MDLKTRTWQLVIMDILSGLENCPLLTQLSGFKSSIEEKGKLAEIT